MDIAVYFEKIDLGSDRFLFKPVNIIRGKYDKENNLFETEYGILCESIGGKDYEYDAYFGFPTTEEELKSKLGNDTSIETLLNTYLTICMDSCYISYYDYNDQIIKVRQFSFDDIERSFENEELEENRQTDLNAEDVVEEFSAIMLDMDSLKQMRDLKSLKAIKDHLNVLIEILKSENGEVEIPSNFSLKKEESNSLNLKEMRKQVLKRIINQDKAVNDITREIVINQTSKNPRNKSHILVVGPSGTGKTEIVSTVAKLLDIPYFEADATAYTQEGYVGKSVYSMLTGLINAAGGDIKKAQNGILIIDEIDKKLSSRSDDVSGISVLYSLLKIMDRGTIELDIVKMGTKENILFDTSNLTIIFMGAFEEIYDSKMKENNKQSIGFSATSSKLEKKDIIITKEDLVKAGLPVQFLGRIGDVTSTNFFTVKELERILTKSEISPLLIQKQFFKDQFNIELKYTKGFVNAIAKKAEVKGTNARELKALVKEAICVAYDDIASRKNKVKTLKLTKDTALDPKKYCIE